MVYTYVYTHIYGNKDGHNPFATDYNMTVDHCRFVPKRQIPFESDPIKEN